MSICQRKTGAWLVKYKDAVSGTWKQRQFKTKEAAEEFDAAAKIALEKDSPLSLREAVLAYLQSRELSEKRVWDYDYLVNGNNRKDGTHRQGPAEHLADRYVESLTRQDLESVRSRLRTDGLEITTINLITGQLKAVLSWCESEDLISVNPWRKYKALPGGKNEHKSGTMDQLKAVYAELPPYAQWAVKTALALCLRPGPKELFSLEWSVFDWQAKTASVYMPKVKATKTVFVPDWYLAEAWPRYQADTAAGHTLVCRNTHNRQIVYTGFRSCWERACEKACVKITAYAIRHIAASEMLYAGADMASVAAQLGHKDITTTAAFYTHALAKGQQRAAAALPDATKLGG